MRTRTPCFSAWRDRFFFRMLHTSAVGVPLEIGYTQAMQLCVKIGMYCHEKQFAKPSAGNPASHTRVISVDCIGQYRQVHYLQGFIPRCVISLSCFAPVPLTRWLVSAVSFVFTDNVAQIAAGDAVSGATKPLAAICGHSAGLGSTASSGSRLLGDPFCDAHRYHGPMFLTKANRLKRRTVRVPP